MVDRRTEWVSNFPTDCLVVGLCAASAGGRWALEDHLAAAVAQLADQEWGASDGKQ